MLGFSFDEGIKAEEMLKSCKQRVNEVCSNARYGNLSVFGRVTIANAVLLGALWYYIPLWAGDLENLERIKKQIVNFVWSGASLNTRHRASTKIITQSLSEGGLGLISLTAQYAAFAARTLRWAYHEGRHPLQLIIRATVEEMSTEAFGGPGTQWIHTTTRSKPSGVSTVVTNIMTTQEKLKVLVTAGPLHNRGDWLQIPLWDSDREAKDGKTRKVDTRAKRLLWEAGFRKLEDMTTSNREELAEWEQRRHPGVESGAVQRTFIKVEKETMHVIKSKQLPNKDRFFKPVEVISFRAGQGRTRRLLAEKTSEETKELVKLRWRNGGSFFGTSKRSIRKMLNHNKDVIWEKITRWSGIAEALPANQMRWGKIWKSRRARREGFLLWSIVLRIVPMNGWRFPSLPLRWCKRCNRNEVEDTAHVFWGCENAQKPWKEIEKFAADAMNYSRWKLKCHCALLAEDLPRELQKYNEWWETLII
ncbi:hypothetical protein R1sor_012960 [Riccia sorocarpa]|uniref:Reverse transcriptase zinc-binding domain-containing protein n=1 Tax=Riccia sorocarpa TaxID=122646 RepID=A0ABD3IBF3_9MARC